MGEDTRHLIPVLQRVGLTVVQSLCTQQDVERSAKEVPNFDAAVFHTDLFPMPPLIIPTIRKLTSGPFIVFETSNTCFDETAFDLIVPPLTPPHLWLAKLRMAILASRYLRAESRLLCTEAANTRLREAALQKESRQELSVKFDMDAFWRGHPNPERRR